MDESPWILVDSHWQGVEFVHPLLYFPTLQSLATDLLHETYANTLVPCKREQLEFRASIDVGQVGRILKSVWPDLSRLRVFHT